MSKSGIIVFIYIFIISYVTFSLADNSSPADTASEKDTTETTVPPPPDSAYIARASSSDWWKRKIENKAFNVGEYMKFKVRYGHIPAGMAYMEVLDTVDYEGFKSFKIRSVAHSNAFVSTFFKVRDTVTTIVDYDGIFTHFFNKKLREGHYKKEQSTLFDQRKHLAITGEDTIRTYAFVQDAFSALYFARTQTIEPGVDLLVDNHTDRKNYPLEVIVHGRDSVEVEAGKFDCIVVEPVMRAEGIFKAKGRIKIWLTNDRYKLPVKMQTEVFFLGAIHADLVEYRLGTFPEDEIGAKDEE